MKNSNSVFSEDNFFICGLYALLGRDFIDNFFTVVDFDYQDKNVLFIPLPEHKDSVAFVSNDFAFYKAERCGIHYALDKKSSIRDILSFFCSSVIRETIRQDKNSRREKKKFWN
ncbi:TPA: hypothetical protein ROB10_002166 [Escherichia coli]|nr:hypothetical protein [Escherichia coli]